MAVEMWAGIWALSALVNAAPMVVLDELPTTLLPLYADSAADRRVSALLFEPLFYRTGIDSELKSNLVDRYVVHADGAAIELYLRRDAHWADGQPVDAEDVCFTIEALLMPTNPVPDVAEHRARLSGCAPASEGASAMIQFRRPVASPRDWLQLPVLPSHGFSSPIISPDHAFARGAFGSRDRRAVLHEDRVEVSSTGGRGPLDGPMEIRRQAAGGIASAAIHVQAPRSVVERQPPGTTVRSFPTREIWFVAIRPTGPMADVALRRSLDASVDRAALIEAVWGARYAAPDAVTGPFLHTSPFYRRASDGMSHPRTELVEPPSLTLGIRRGDAAVQPDLARAVAEQLTAAGWPVTVVELEDGSASPPASVDLMVVRWPVPLTDHVAAVVRPDGPANPFGVSDPTAVSLLEAMEDAATFEEQVSSAHGLHAHLQESVFALWLSEGLARSVWPNAVPRVAITPGTYWTEVR